MEGLKIQVKVCPLNRLMCRFRSVIGIGEELWRKAEKSFFVAGSMGRLGLGDFFGDL